MPYIFMKISAPGLHLADCALPHAVWFGHNPSLCLEVGATPTPHPPPHTPYSVLNYQRALLKH